MIAFARWLTTLRYPYDDPLQRQRAQLLQYILSLLLVSNVVSTVLITLNNLVEGQALNVGGLVTAVVVILATVALTLAIQRGYVRQVAFLTVIYITSLIALLYFTPAIDVDFGSAAFIGVFGPVLIAGLVLEQRDFLIMLPLSYAVILIMGVAEYGTIQQLFQNDDVLIGFFIVLMLSLFLFSSVSSVAQIVLLNQRDVQQLRTLSRLTLNASESTDDQVFAHALDLARNDLGYGFAQIFLLDESGQLTRRFRTGLNIPEGGVVTEVEIGDASALIEAITTNQSVLVSLDDNIVRRGHFLPSSRFGIAVPIRVNRQIIAVLDVQQSQQELSATDEEVLASLALRIGAVLSSGRTIANLRETLNAQEDTVRSLRAQLREFKTSQSEIVGLTWDSYLQDRARQAIGFDLTPDDARGVHVTAAQDLPDDLLRVMQQGEVVIERERDPQVVQVPIVVRGEVLGAMAFDVPPGRPISDRQIEFAQSVTTRLALALENKRLFERSQAQALRERQANEVAGVLIGATDVNDLITLAADSFRDALGAVATRIQLDSDALADEPEQTNLEQTT
jgi:GAF domain-containing protein